MQRMTRALRWVFDHVSWQPTQDEFVQAMARIQPEERRRVMQFVFQKDVKPALVGRLMLRSCAAQIFRFKNNDIVLTRTEKGKPILQSIVAEPFDFNVSHHGSLVTLACDSCIKIGIDIMKIEDNENIDYYFKLMNRIFSDKEWSYIKDGAVFDGSRSSLAQMRRFLRLWSLKESYFKAEGMGITTDLRSIEFNCKSDLQTGVTTEDTEVVVEGKLISCVFQETILQDHCIAVCLFGESNSKAAQFEKVSFQRLISLLEPLNDADDNHVQWQVYDSKLYSPQ